MAIKLSNLPIHHIDTSVILEPRRTEGGRYCTKYLQKVGYNYSGVLSIQALGEILLSITLIEEYDERHNLLDTVYRLIKSRKISYYSPQNIENIISRIKKIDHLIDPIDAQILACAIEDRSNLVTIDKKLVRNAALEKEFGIKILHPKDLL